MEDAPIVSVRGEALLEVDPEIAQVTVAIAAMDKERDRTLAALDKRTQSFTTLIESFGEAVERVETSGLHISPQFKDNRPRERVVGYHATVRHSVFVKDFTRLGDMVVRLAEQELTDVGGPWWSLRKDSDVYRQARMRATEDAVRRAREYAEAVGSTVTALIELADVGLLSEAATAAWPGPGGPPMPSPMAAPAMRLAGHAAGPPEVTLHLEPARQMVRANVEARFRLSPATLA